MAATFDENGATVVGNKVMLSGKTTAGASAAIDVSPYMRVIEQVIFNEVAQGATVAFRNGADSGDVLINSRQLVEILSDTTFRFFTSAGPEDGLRANTDAAGVFIVIGRK